MNNILEREEKVLVSSGQYRYNLSSTGYSSNHYSNCDICGKYATEVFYQTEEKQYFNPITQQLSWTKNNCFDYFGHKECLLNRRR